MFDMQHFNGLTPPPLITFIIQRNVGDRLVGSSMRGYVVDNVYSFETSFHYAEALTIPLHINFKLG